MKRLGWCEEALKHFSATAECCDFCHEDSDLGYFDLLTIETEDGYYEVCCTVHRACKPNLKLA